MIQVIRNQTRKGVCDFIFAQISFVHIFGGFAALVSAFILMSGMRVFYLNCFSCHEFYSTESLKLLTISSHSYTLMKGS